MSSRSICLWIAALAFGALLSAPAQAETITDGDSSFDLNDVPWSPNSDSANGGFTPNGDSGGATNVYETWWWYRLPGDADESIFYDPATEIYAGSTATFTFTQPTFDAVLTFSILDGDAPQLIQEITIINTSGQDLEIDLFNYLDARLGPDHLNDTAILFGPDAILIESSDGTPLLLYSGPGAAGYLVSDNDSGDIEKLFRDDLPTDFDSSGLPFTLGDGNFNAGFQFGLLIPAGGSLSSSVSIGAGLPLPPPNVSPSPEPTSTVLVGASLAGLAWWHRRRRRKAAA